MRGVFGSLSAYLPAALLLLFAAWAGTLAGAAGAAGALAGHLALLLCLALAAGRWRDPLDLGRSGRVLLLALLLSVAMSLLLSPVPRAGRLAILVPAALLVPRAVAGWWADARRRRTGLRAVSLVVAGVAAVSLIDAWRLETAAALPLGHHNLLAAWLVTLLPISLLPWRDGAGGRWLALAAGLLGGAALLATGSLAAAVAAAAVAVPAALSVRKGWLAVAAAALFLAPQVPRLLGLVAGDPSLQARWGYLAAGWRGFLERPALGWGPGSTAWTIGEHLRPRPGIHPPDEVVADLHCLPLQLAYELGAGGLLLALGVGLVFWRRRRQGAAADPGLRRAALLGLAALAVMSVAGLPLSVTALPVAALVVAGGLLVAVGGPAPTSSPWPPLATALAIAAVVLPLDLAQAAYDRAATAADPGLQARHLRRAVRLDPDFPLYRARLAWLDGELGGPDREIARRAERAAVDAYGVAPLWLVAGVLAQEAGGPGSREALERACRLSPLGALAPFRLALGEPAQAMSAEWGARALLAEPRLLAAAAWGGRRELFAAAVVRAVAAPGVDRGWRQRLGERFAGGLELAGATRRMALAVDGEGSASLSLYAFRRRPWPAELAPVALSANPLERLDLVPATVLSTTAPEVFNRPGPCDLP